LFDQNFDRRLLPLLRTLGRDVKVVAIDYPPGIPDRQVLALAYEEGRILLTNDRDFGELAVREQLPHAGIIYLRMRRVSAEAKWERLAAVLRDNADQLDQFLSVSEYDVRIA
jgi:predicted nuclease of predicted toxin-antitoxin system